MGRCSASVTAGGSTIPAGGVMVAAAIASQSATTLARAVNEPASARPKIIENTVVLNRIMRVLPLSHHQINRPHRALLPVPASMKVPQQNCRKTWDY